MTSSGGSKRDDLAAARRVLPVFDGSRLVAIRELLGLTQANVAEATGISAPALSQAERCETKLSAANVVLVANVFGVTPEAFAERPEPSVALAPQFRHLRRTPKIEQRKAERLVHATAQVALVLREAVQFPRPFDFAHEIDPDLPIEYVADEVEEAAAIARSKLGIPLDEPIAGQVIDYLEAGGVTVVRDPDTDADIDAYSAIVDDLPIIILDGGADSVWDRDNFNLAHELGHLVMHRGIDRTPGFKTVEAQAHRFAGAFLGPASALRPHLPTEIDWNQYFRLKRQWGLSMAALVRRAKDLGVIDDETYTRAMKQRSSHGWKRVEPGSGDQALPAPRYLNRAASLASMSSTELAQRILLPESVVDRIIGDQLPSLVD